MTVFLVLGRNNPVEDSVFLSVLCFLGVNYLINMLM